MPVGDYPYRISRQKMKWIRDAAEVLVGLFCDDVRSLIEGHPFEETFMYNHLPERYRHHYDLTFAQQFLDVMIVVAWKVRDRTWWRLNSVAEELAMRAILSQAEVQANSEGKKFSSYDLTDAVFEDSDIEFLFDQHLDGIEDDEFFVKRLGLANLSFADWFKPFRPSGMIGS